jgi:hypothetical protein
VRATLLKESEAGPFVMRKASNADIMGPDRLRTFEGVEPMGRGRAKAKQVKVARQLKYNSGGTDLDRLRAELGVGADQHDREYDPVSADHDDEDEDDTEEDEDDEWRPSS